jgi:hypothetical protein
VVQLAKSLTGTIGQKLTADIQRKFKTPPTINLNIQITLPVTENEKVYENIFKAIRKNLLDTESQQTQEGTQENVKRKNTS